MPNNDLISRKALIEQIEEDAKHMMFTSHHSRMLHDDMVEFAVNAIECAPAVDAEPVKHSEWVEEKDRVRHWHCRECGLVEGMAHYMMHYCPNCGAKMEAKT